MGTLGRFGTLVLLASAAVVAAALANCALEGFNRVEVLGGAGGVGGVAPSGGGGSGGQDAGVCAHTGIPQPPSVQDAGGDLEVVTAVHKAFMLEDANGGPLGLDLDKTCTCQGEGPTCQAEEKSVENGFYCDLEAGRDNAMRRLFVGLGNSIGQPDLGAFYSEAAHLGQWSLLLQVSGYNGQPDDDQVSLAAITTASFGMGFPVWDGSDVWPVSAAAFESDGKGGVDISKPLHVDHLAYVAGGVVIANLPETEIVFAGTKNRLTLRATGGLFMARLVETAGGWSLRDGLIAGRLGIDELFAAFGSFRDNAGKPLCTDSIFYPTGKALFCTAPDILKGLGSPGLPCDAVSIAIGFEADPAILGLPVVQPPPADNCPAETDPTFDNCDIF